MCTRSTSTFLALGGLFLSVAFAPSAGVAASSHLWSHCHGAAGSSTRGYSIAVDGSGHVLMAGSFNGTVDFGGGALVSQGTDIVLAKYTAAGVHLWSKRFGGTSADQAYALALDAAGNLFVTGYFQGTTNVGGGTMVGNGNNDVFIAKYNANGTHLWSYAIGTPDADTGYAIATDQAGNAFVTGYFHGIAPSDIFLAKYGPLGAIIWIKILGGEGYDEALSVAVDEPGNVLLTGSFSGTVNFGGGNLSTPGDDWDVFLAKYDPAGTHLWSQRFGDTDLEAGLAIQTDVSNHVLVTGYFKGTVSFGGDPLVSMGDDVDVFLARYDANGLHQWSRRLGGASYEAGNALAVDGFSNVFVTGYFDGTANFGGADLVSDGNIDIFFAEYDANGNHMASQRFGDTTGDAGQAIAVDDDGNRYMTGYFDGAVDFGGGDLVASGTPDLFIAKFGRVVSAAGPLASLDALAISAAPNPFNPSTTLHYRIPAPGRVGIAVYDLRGRRVAQLLDEERDAGAHTVAWQGHDLTGETAASGVYFARIVYAGTSRTHKLVLLK